MTSWSYDRNGTLQKGEVKEGREGKGIHVDRQMVAFVVCGLRDRELRRK